MVSSYALAAAMQSTNYKIESDSVNVGGVRSSSGSYIMEDTMGEVGTGVSSSANYILKAGYQQMQGSYLSLSAPTDITMTPLSLSQNTAVGSAGWTVITDNGAGYTLSINASSTSPCPLNAGGVRNALCNMSTSNAFTDLATTSKTTWAVSSAYKFGYSVFGNDTTGHGTDADCIAGTDVPSATLLWQGFDGTKLIEIASSTSRTSPSGTVSTLCVAVEQNSVFAPSGTYQATTTATLIAL